MTHEFACSFNAPEDERAAGGKYQIHSSSSEMRKWRNISTQNEMSALLLSTKEKWLFPPKFWYFRNTEPFSFSCSVFFYRSKGRDFQLGVVSYRMTIRLIEMGVLSMQRQEATQHVPFSFYYCLSIWLFRWLSKLLWEAERKQREKIRRRRKRMKGRGWDGNWDSPSEREGRVRKCTEFPHKKDDCWEIQWGERSQFHERNIEATRSLNEFGMGEARNASNE